MVNAKLDSLIKKLKKLSFAGHPSQVFSCEVCGGGHSTTECQQGNSYSQDCSIQQLNALNNLNGRPQGNPYSNTYNPGWRNHLNFSWSNQGRAPNYTPNYQAYEQPPSDFQSWNTCYQPESESNMESMMEKFLKVQQQQRAMLNEFTQ